MAVYAAHLTRTLQGTPSVFQVTAEEALGATIKPALRKVAEYLSAVYPNKCGWCTQWYDELYLVFDCCLQYYYLKHYAASFSESFYGLIRVPIDFTSEFSSGQRLPVYLERASLVMLVFVPYLRDKVDQVVDKWREDDEDGRLGKSAAGRARRAAVRVRAGAQLAWAAARLALLARYMCGARSPRPALAALRLALRPAPPAAPPPHTWRDFFTGLLTGHLGSAVVTFPMLGDTVLRAAEYGAFAVQFLRWWDSRGALAHAGALPAPPPQRDERSLRWKNKCPLCLQSWKIPTVLPVSGYIFCYVCILRHVRAHGACPVSRLPAAEAALLRLYLH